MAFCVGVEFLLNSKRAPLRQRERGLGLNQQQYDNRTSRKSETGTDGGTGAHSKRLAVGRLGSREQQTASGAGITVRNWIAAVGAVGTILCFHSFSPAYSPIASRS